jgi:hypothetical protein
MEKCLKTTNNEKIIFDIIATSRSRTTKGDLSDSLLEQGFFDEGTIPRGLKERHDLHTGNPIDIKDELKDQGFFDLGKDKKKI